MTSDTLASSTARAAEQTAAYGHDSGYFRLGRSESSHEIGCRGELIARQFIDDLAVENLAVSLNVLGHASDLRLVWNGREVGIHVKTGLYRARPTLDQPFGVHFGQHLEMTGSALLLISLMRDEPEKAIVEGYLSPEDLASKPVIRKGEQFPGRTYSSRTNNRLTFIQDYQPFTQFVLRQILEFSR